jgi:hypothetical protein
MCSTDSRRTAALTVIVVALICGCGERPDTSDSSSPAPNGVSISKEELLRAVAEAEREAEIAEIPDSVIELPAPAGWIRSEPRGLPVADHGFMIGYNHPAGVSVTFYQYTRGHTVIPDDLTTDLVERELQRAKDGIELAVQLDYWQSAEETDHGAVALGDSSQEALWSRYSLTADGVTVASDVFVWVHANTILKLRCTGRSQDPEAEREALASLLTPFGRACEPSADESG